MTAVMVGAPGATAAEAAVGLGDVAGAAVAGIAADVMMRPETAIATTTRRGFTTQGYVPHKGGFAATVGNTARRRSTSALV